MAPRPRTRLRRSLRACTAEGAVAEVVAACCGGAALTGWALHLGMGARMVGVVTALPIASQMLQLVGAFLTARFGHRRTALAAVALSRQAFLPLAVVPLLPLGPDGRRALLLVVAGAHHGLGIVANNAWTDWMGDMVPARIRGRYFGRRTALCTVVGGATALLAGVALDRGRSGAFATAVLQATAAVACAAGGASVALMARQHAAPARRVPIRRAARALVRPLRDHRARRAIVHAIAWNGACGLSAPFFGWFVLDDLRGGYALLAAEGAGLAVAKVATASAWGRAIDRVGPRRVLIACTAGLALSPVAWLACGPGRLWPLALETVLGGALLGGHAVATFALPLAVATPRDRPFTLGTIAMAGGVAFAATSATGCALLAGAGTGHAPVRVLLAASAALRACGVAAAVALPRDAVRTARAARIPPAVAPPVREVA